ncbi:CBS domain-containing protein [Sphingobium sp. HBC34]|uniref:CBS domain-containing protein n=1 Tax=Sphingobium cyanobacteriorum TaxID=3063954 RepID=A0ABT8ZT45_9SPHN|nr:CBS domain-containing protein [Sphingobium sp. HBC34]MDO7837366.1 CBS domain-containing protein [Sphingobium sp. HBC34]
MKIASIVNRKGRQITSIRETAPMAEAVETMHSQSIGSVAVLGASSSEILGIFSQQELTECIAVRGIHALQLPVLIFMRKPALFCNCEDNAANVMRTMTRDRCRHVIVRTVGGALAGIVSLGDLVAALLEEAQLEAGVLRDMARSHLLAMPS